MKQQRMVGLDIFRIISAATVFLFHQQLHLGCSYGFLNEYILMGAIFMTGFYMLSGYVMYDVYAGTDLAQKQNRSYFYGKRMAGLLPLYYVAGAFYVLFLGKESWEQNLLLLPVELFGLQAMFPGLFFQSHNSGTWFLSCLMACYILFPFLQQLLQQMGYIQKFIIGAVIAGILLLAPFIALEFGTADIYANPFFRLIEFTIGSLLCSLANKEKIQAPHAKVQNILVFSTAFIVFIAAVSYAVKRGFYVHNYLLYNIFSLPLLILMLVAASKITGGGELETGYLP